ncbi:unnamed protein product [Aureobasidium mustum]|uniref:Uncharacterized protein n=1 Tax=Aureobasidium mustum TaxID=2773714 RepID=A0A9N8PP03_9PEZI|nr:unnamed protein product [Aureobasidium mustum]
MSNSSFRMFSTAAKASMRPASMPVKVRSPYNMSAMLQEITDIEARYKGPANAANMTLDEMWDDYYVIYRRAGPVLMWEEPWMPVEAECLPYETVNPEAPEPEASEPEGPKPREYYLQMVLYEGPETDEEKPEEPEDKPANASEATPEPATRPRQGIFDSIWAETPTSRFSHSQQPQTQKSTTSSSSPPKQSSSPFSGPPKQKSTTSSQSPPKQASRSDSCEPHKHHCSSPPSNKSSTHDNGENHKNHRRRNQKSAKQQPHPQTHSSTPRHNHKSAQQQQHPQTHASMPRQPTTTFNTPPSHAHPQTQASTPRHNHKSAQQQSHPQTHASTPRHTFNTPHLTHIQSHNH